MRMSGVVRVRSLAVVVVVALLAAGPALANACNGGFDLDLDGLARSWSALVLCVCCAPVLLACVVLGVGLKACRFRAATLSLSSCGVLFGVALLVNVSTAPAVLSTLLVLTTFASAVAAVVQWQSVKDGPT